MNASIDEAGVIQALAEYVKAQTGESVEPDVPLMESGILDSMAMVLFVAYVEETFDLDIGVEALGGNVLRTIRSSANYVANGAASAATVHQGKTQ